MPHSVHVNAGDWQAPAAHIEAGVRAALDEVGDRPAEVSVTLVDEPAIRGLNREYLREEGPTDVISFSLGEEGGDVLGDVYVCYPQAERQALEAGVPVTEELVRLAVHGTLHVLGHDHPEGPERWESEMYRIQEEIVRAVLGRPIG